MKGPLTTLIKGRQTNFEDFWSFYTTQPLSNGTGTLITFFLFGEIILYHLHDFYQYFSVPDSIFEWIINQTIVLIPINLASESLIFFYFLKASLLTLIALYFISFLVLHKISSKRSQHKWIEWVLRMFYLFYNPIILYPTFRIFLADIICNPDLLATTNETCLQGTNLVFWILEAVGLILCAYLTIVYHWYCVGSYYDKKNSLSGESRLLEISLTVLRVLASLINAIGSNHANSFKGNFYIAMMLFLSFFLAIMFMYTIPYAKPSVEYFCLGCIVIFFAECLTCAAYIIQRSACGTLEWNISTNFVLIFVVIAPAILGLYNYRKSKLLIDSHSKSTSVSETVRRSHLLFELGHSSYKSERADMLLRGLIDYHQRNCKVTICFCKKSKLFDSKKGTSVSSEKMYNFKVLIIKCYTQRIFEEMLDHYPRSIELLVAYAEFLFHRLRNCHYCLVLLHKAGSLLQQSPRAAAKYRIIKLKNLIFKQISTDNLDKMPFKLDIEHAIFVEDQFKTILTSMSELSNGLITFWEYFLNKEVSLKQIYHYIQNITTNIQLINTLWEPLKPFFDQHKRLKFHYYWYLKDFMNQRMVLNEEDVEELTEESDRLLITSKQFFQFNEREDKERNNGNHIVFEEDSCVIQVCGNIARLGAIMRVNESMPKVFGFTKKELEGSNVEMLMPKNFSKHHQKYMASFVEAAESEILYKARHTFGKHKSGFIFPMWIVIKQICSIDGDLDYTSLIKPIHQDTQKDNSGYLLFEEYGEIAGISLDLSEILGINCALVETGELNLLMFAPHLIKSMRISHLLEEDNIRQFNLDQQKIDSARYQNESGIFTQREWDFSKGSSTLLKLPKYESLSWDQLLKLEMELERNEVHDYLMSKYEEYDANDVDEMLGVVKAGQIESKINEEINFTIRVPKDIRSYLNLFESERTKLLHQINHLFEPQSVSFNAQETINTHRKDRFVDPDLSIFPSPRDTSRVLLQRQTDKPLSVRQYLDCVKAVATAIIQTSKEHQIIKVKASIVTRYSGPNQDATQYLKVLSHEKIQKSERVQLVIRKSAFFRDDITKNLLNYVPKNENVSEETKSYLQQGEGDNLNRSQRPEEQKDDFEFKKPEHQEVKALADPNVLIVKASIVTNSRSLFEKEDFQQIHRHHRVFVFLKWLLRISFLTLIPISIIVYLCGSKNALENLSHTLEVGVFALRMLDAHLKAEASIVALSYLNGASYDGLLTQEQTTEIITNAQQTLNASIAIIDSQLTNEYFSEIMYKYYINWDSENLSEEEQVEITATVNQEISALTFQNGSEPDPLDQLYDAPFFALVQDLELIAKLDASAISLENAVVYEYSQQALTQILGKLFDISRQEFQSFSDYTVASERLLIFFMLAEIGLLLLCTIVIIRYLYSTFDLEKTIFDVFTLVNECSITDALRYYQKLSSCFVQDDILKKKMVYANTLIEEAAEKKKPQNLQRIHKVVDSAGFFGNAKILITAYIIFSIVVGLMLSLITLIIPIKFLKNNQEFGDVIQQLCLTNVNLPLFEVELKQSFIDTNFYVNYILPVNADEIAKLPELLKLTPIQNAKNSKFYTKYNLIMFSSACEAFKDVFTASEYETCRSVALQTLDRGLLAFSSYFIATAEDTLLQTEDQASASQFNSIKLYDFDQAAEIINVIRDEMVTITLSRQGCHYSGCPVVKGLMETEFANNYSETILSLNWTLSTVSVLIFFLMILVDQMVYRKIYLRYRFIQNFFNKYMITDALEKEKRIKAILVKKKIL